MAWFGPGCARSSTSSFGWRGWLSGEVRLWLRLQSRETPPPFGWLSASPLLVLVHRSGSVKRLQISTPLKTMRGVLRVMASNDSVVLGVVPIFTGWRDTWLAPSRSSRDDIVLGRQCCTRLALCTRSALSWSSRDDVVLSRRGPDFCETALYSVGAISTLAGRHCTWSASSRLLRNGVVLGWLRLDF